MYTLDPSKMQNALLMQAGDDVTLKVKTVKGASVANVINLTNNSLK